MIMVLKMVMMVIMMTMVMIYDDDDDDDDDNSSSPCKTVANLLGELRCLKDYSTKSNVAHIAANDKYGSNSCK